MPRGSADRSGKPIGRVRCSNCSRTWAVYHGRLPRMWNEIGGKVFCDLRQCNAAYDRLRRGLDLSKVADHAYQRAGSGKLHEPSTGNPRRAACGASGVIAPEGVESNCQSTPCRKARARKLLTASANEAARRPAAERRPLPHGSAGRR